MAKNYAPIAEAIVKQLGGVNNIDNVTHCMTRLRFVLRDNQSKNLDAIKKIDGVMGVIEASGQIQVIIGNNVGYAYKEVVKLGDFGEASDIAKGVKKEKMTPKTIYNGMIDGLIGTMSPIIPPIIGGSMIKLIAMMLEMAGIISITSSTYLIMTAIGDAAFYFLPIMVAVSASKKFKVNTYLAIAIAGVLVHPTFIDLMAQAAEGKKITLAAIPILSVKYTYTVIPPLIMTWVLSYIERWIDSITPAIFKNFLKPLLIMAIAAPIAIIVIGPMGNAIGYGISQVVFVVHDKLGWLAVAIMGALWPLLVMTSMHRVFTPTIISTIAETGVEGVVMPCQLGANLAQGGASLAVAVKTKNKGMKQTALAAAASALVAGITEPAMYGVTLRLKRPLISVLITGFVCGAIAGIVGLKSRSMAAPGIFTSVQFFDPKDSMSIVWVVVIIVVAISLSFILTLILGFEDIPEEVEINEEKIVIAAGTQMNIVSPVHGKMIALKDVKDEVFSQKMVGEGVAVYPSEGKVFAPFDGVVMQSETGHAVGITSLEGVEVLIHIGMDTVELDGKGFKTYFKTGDHVKAGELLVEFDIEFIKEKGYDIVVPIVITNTDNFKEVKVVDIKEVKTTDVVLQVLV